MSKTKLVIMAIIGVLIGGIFYFYSTMKVSIIDEIEPKFTGYDTIGRVEYSIENVEAKIDKVLSDKSKSEQDEIRKDIFIHFDKEENLSNGQEITLSISAPEDSKIASETKKFKVKGLKETTTKTIAEIVKDHPITISGQNYFSELKYDTSILQLNKTQDSSDMNYGAYYNGEKLEFKLNEGYVEKLKASGILIKNVNDIFEYTVSNLKDIPELMSNTELPKINNLKQYINETDRLALADSTDVESKYYKFGGFFGPKTKITQKSVTKYGTFIKKSVDDKNTFEILVLYKINRSYSIPNCSELEGNDCGKTEKKSTEVYALYGNQYIEIKDGAIQNKPRRDIIKSTDTLNEMIDTLKNEKYMIFTNK